LRPAPLETFTPGATSTSSIEVAPVERQLADLRRIDHRPERRRTSYSPAVLRAGDREQLADLTDRHLEVDDDVAPALSLMPVWTTV
jgi:hypothetical protein